MKSKFFHLILICLILSLPFERLLTFDAFGFTLKISYLFGVLAIMVALADFFKNRKIKFDLIDKLAFCFPAYALLSVIWSIDPKRTLIISFLYLFVFLLLIVIKHFSDLKKKEIYLNLLLSVGVLLSIFAIWQFFSNSFGIFDQFSFLRDEYKKGVFPFPRVQATFLEPLFFANFLLIPILIAVKKAFEKPADKLISFFLFLTLVAFILTLSRGAYLALVVSFLAFSSPMILIFRHKFSKFIPILLTTVVAVIFSYSLIYFSTGQSGVNSYVSQATKTTDVDNPSAVSDLDYLRTRNYTVEVAQNHIKQNFLGIGTGAFGSLPEFKLLKDQGRYQTVNNEYLEILVENGVVGFVLFLLLIISILVSVYRQILASKDFSSTMFLAIFLGWLVQYLTFSNLYLIYIWVFAGLMLAGRQIKQES